MYRHIASAGWAFAIVAVSLGALYALDAAHITIGSLHPLKWLVWVALAPVFPAWLTLLALGGGPHALSGELWLMPATGVLSFLLWWGIIGSWRRLRPSCSFHRRTTSSLSSLPAPLLHPLW